MKIVVAYVTVTNGPKTLDLAARFAETYHDNPPGMSHDSIVICNGGPPKTDLGMMLAELNPQFFPRHNDGGWDISGYIDAASGPCNGYDMMLCFGESVHFSKPGWLIRFVEAWNRHGPGMYGAFASNAVRPHINTTGFCIAPKLLHGVKKPRNKDERYDFEHGKNAFWRQVAGRGFPVWLVTWDGEYPPKLWRTPRNCFWKGDQSNCLFRVNHTDRFENANADTKTKWSRMADSAFR